MLQSMTGYGQALCKKENVHISATVKSLNSKHLDMSMHLPKALANQEISWRRLVGEELKRGKITIVVHILYQKDIQEALLIDQALFKAYYQVFQGLKKDLKAETDVFGWAARSALAHKAHEPEADTNTTNHATKTLLQALKQCVHNRQIEGQALTEQIITCLNTLESKLEAITNRDPQRIKTLRQQLYERLHTSEVTLDQERLAQEQFYYIQKMDIKEELVRLAQHLNYFKATMKQQIPTGKKLLFIAQEMLREANTIASKAQDTELQHHVIHMKDVLEQVKEQLQNIS